MRTAAYHEESEKRRGRDQKHEDNREDWVSRGRRSEGCSRSLPRGLVGLWTRAMIAAPAKGKGDTKYGLRSKVRRDVEPTATFDRRHTGIPALVRAGTDLRKNVRL